MPRHHRIHGSTLLLAMILALPAAAQQQTKTAPSCPARPISLGLYEFGRYYHAGSGFDKDIADLLAQRSGCKFELRVLTRGRIWQDLQGGGLDMTLSAVAAPERLQFAWNTPYMWVRNMMILGKDVDTSVHSIADFLATPYLRLGVMRGYYAGKPYDSLIAQLRNIGRVEDIDDTERLYAMLRAGRFHAMVGSQMVYTGYLKEGEVRIEDWAQGGAREQANLLVSKKNFSQEEARRWGELLKAMVSDGSMQRMLSQYVPAADAAKMLAP